MKHKRKLDGRYREGADTGSMSSQSMSFPIKKPEIMALDDTPKQIIRQIEAKQKNKKFKNVHKRNIRK